MFLFILVYQPVYIWLRQDEANPGWELCTVFYHACRTQFLHFSTRRWSSFKYSWINYTHFLPEWGGWNFIALLGLADDPKMELRNY